MEHEVDCWDRRPDGKKKAYVRLTSDHDALDVANKVSRRVMSIER